MAKPDDTALVLAEFRRYAERGSFRSLTDRTDGAKTQLRFTWLREVGFEVSFDAGRRTLTFIDMLPAIPARSPMDRHLREFVKRFTSTAVPLHRRVEARRIGVKAVNRDGAISIEFAFKTKDTTFAVRKAVHLAYDVLQDFLNDGRYAQYCVDHFNLNPEMA